VSLRVRIKWKNECVLWKSDKQGTEEFLRRDVLSMRVRDRMKSMFECV
jgi:hypothetical protein